MGGNSGPAVGVEMNYQSRVFGSEIWLDVSGQRKRIAISMTHWGGGREKKRKEKKVGRGGFLLCVC